MFQSNPKTHNETNPAKRVKKVPKTEPKSPLVENGRTTAPPPQVEISAKTPSRDRDQHKNKQAEIGENTPG